MQTSHDIFIQFPTVYLYGRKL